LSVRGNYPIATLRSGAKLMLAAAAAVDRQIEFIARSDQVIGSSSHNAISRPHQPLVGRQGAGVSAIAFAAWTGG